MSQTNVECFTTVKLRNTVIPLLQLIILSHRCYKQQAPNGVPCLVYNLFFNLGGFITAGFHHISSTGNQQVLQLNLTPVTLCGLIRLITACCKVPPLQATGGKYNLYYHYHIRADVFCFRCPSKEDGGVG